MEYLKKVFIIAEAGVNHNGSIKNAKRLIDVAKSAGADAVKFQSFEAEKLVTGDADKADYQKKAAVSRESQYTMLRRLELSKNDFFQIIDYCKNKRIHFLSSAFDLDNLDFLINLGMKIFKIPSGEITNLPYLRKIGVLNKKVILSTGMADLAEIKDALNILMNSGTKKTNITVLHCNTAYPTPYEDVNLRAMLTIQNAFDISVGYSDHTLGIEIPIAAVALGALIIEKHFTLDRGMRGPDHQASLEPHELKAMIYAIRNVEKSLGNGIKKPSKSEIKNKLIVRKSIVAAKDINKGERFTAENITTKRPGNGLSPMLWDAVLGRRAGKDYAEDDLIEL